MNFEKVMKLMDDSVKFNNVPCSDILVTYKGKEVLRYYNGTRDDEKKVPLKGDELYFLYSATKVITCTAMMQLWEKGLFSLEDEVAKYIPEYADLRVKTPKGVVKSETPLKMKHLFTMTSGLDYNLERGGILQLKEQNPKASTLEMVKTFVQEPVEFEPGSHYLYSLSHDVLGAILEVVSGMSLSEYLKKNIFDVCGMVNTGFTLNDDIRSRMCSQYRMDEETGVARLIEKENEFILTPDYQSGGAGLISCVEDYARFVTELANGNRILKKETIDLMRQNHLGEQARKEFSGMKRGYTYGLGVRTNRDSDFSAIGEYGWDGAAGAYALIDPDNHIAVFYATHICNHGAYLYDKLHLDLRDAIYDVVKFGR